MERKIPAQWASFSLFAEDGECGSHEEIILNRHHIPLGSYHYYKLIWLEGIHSCMTAVNNNTSLFLIAELECCLVFYWTTVLPKVNKVAITVKICLSPYLNVSLLMLVYITSPAFIAGNKPQTEYLLMMTHRKPAAKHLWL